MDQPVSQPRADAIFHGGNRAAAEARFGRPENGWVDLSTGINPVPYPLPEIPAEAWDRLPEQPAFARACNAAADYYGTGDAAFVMAAPGTQALIQWLPRLRPPGAVAVLGPTYEEHGATWRAAGHTVRTVEDGDLQGAALNADVVVAVNPNNPDGRRYDPSRLIEIAAALNRRGGLLVVDEAFADVDPEISLAGDCGHPGLVILRSFGKFFGLAGLRLGFALGASETLAPLRLALGPWAVGGPALAVATAAFADTPWIDITRQRLKAQARQMDGLLSGAGLAIAGGTDLYRLAESPRVGSLHEHLGGRGILTRPFPGRPTLLRFGLPGDDDAWRRLGEALGDWTALTGSSDRA